MAFGNTQTCDYAGFILVFGVLTVVFYLLFLIYFFWRRVRHRVSPSKFAYGEEKYIHILVCLLAISLASIPLARKEYNPSKLEGAGCMLNSYPNGCGIGEIGDENYIECTRGQSFRKTGMLAGGIIGTSLICIFVLLLSITCHVYTIEKSLSTSSSALQRNNTQNDEPQSSSSPRVKEDLDNHNDEPQSRSTPRIEEDFGEDENNAIPDAENVA